MASMFQAVTTRTAGFFTISQERFSNATYLLCLLLMIIGGSPMGTAGGIKTTTIAVLAMSLLANLRGKNDVEAHNRRIRESYLRSAIVVAGMGLFTVFVMSILLCAAMPEAPVADVIYEIISAIICVLLFIMTSLSFSFYFCVSAAYGDCNVAISYKSSNHSSRQRQQK